MIVILCTFLVSLLNLLTNHAMLTRKRSFRYSLLVYIINTMLIFGIGVLVMKNIQTQVLREYAASFLSFLYIAYIYLVFSESVSKKIFTMFSTWIFSLIAFIIASLVAVLFFNGEVEYSRDIVHILRVVFQILLLFATYLWLGKPYKEIIRIVPDKTINSMSLYPIIAFLLLRTTSFARPDNSLISIYSTLLLIIFIVLGYLITFEAISSSSTMEVQRYMANYDSLTGIANRANIMNQLAKTIEISNRSKLKFALFVCDLDNFKKINDEYGHIVGDKALRYAAQSVQKVLRNTDIAGRFGGDEFLIIQQFINEESDIETLINRIFEELKKPLLIDNNEIQIELSIGVSIFSNNNSDLEILIHQADRAMYEAKKREGCAFNFFEPQTL